MTILFLIVGLALLIAGAELLVRGASNLATRIGLSPLVIGLTVVAFGTSAPELAVSINSALAGQSGIALGNVIGSNIFNVLLILGVAATIAPLLVSSGLIRFHVPLMIVVSFVLLYFAWDLHLSRLEGGLLFSGFVVYTVLLLILGRKQENLETPLGADASLVPLPDRNTSSVVRSVAFFTVGLGLLVFGARWLVASAVEIAMNLGVSESVAGLTIVSAGTSLPELTTSVVASIRGQREMAVGNVVGSNLFNILAVLGLSAIVDSAGIPVSTAVLHFDIPVMVMTAVICLPIFYTGGLIARWEGILLWMYYIAFVLYLVLASVHHDRLEAFVTAMVYFVIPLSVLTVIVSVIQAIRGDSKQATVEDMEGET